LEKSLNVGLAFIVFDKNFPKVEKFN